MRLVGDCIEEYLESLTGRGLATTYRMAEKSIVKDFAHYCGARDMRELRKEDLYGYVLHLRERKSQYGKSLSAGTIARYATSANNYTAWLFQQGLLLVNPADGFDQPKKAPYVPRNIPTQGDMALILDNIDTPRERALFELMYSSGLRMAEARALKVSDVKLDERMLCVWQGKGKKDRTVPFSNPALSYLVRYIQGERNHDVKGLDERQRDYLFIQGSGRLTRWTVTERWKAALTRVGLAGKGYTIHTIRHACATHLLENGASVRYVQELLGHEKLTTTQRYTRPGSERIKAVYRTYHPRENELYEELSVEYLEEVARLKHDLLEGRETQKGKRMRAEYRRQAGISSGRKKRKKTPPKDSLPAR